MNNNQISKDKIKHLKNFIKKYYNPYQSNHKLTIPLVYNYKSKDSKEIAGRIISIRKMGKIIFGDIRYDDNIFQFCISNINNKNLKKDINYDKDLNIGDVIFAKGKFGTSNTGESTFFMESITIVSKNLVAVPDKLKKIQNLEISNREKVLSLSFDFSEYFISKSYFYLLNTIRDYLNTYNFLEVETPILNRLIGGADARPFKSYHNSLKTKLYLRISPELYLKKFITMGFSRVYEFAKVFRNEGISIRHNPEFTLLEMYRSYCNYNDMMDFVENLIKTSYSKIINFIIDIIETNNKISNHDLSSIVKFVENFSSKEDLVNKLKKNPDPIYKGNKINFNNPWYRKNFIILVSDFLNIDSETVLDREFLISTLQKYNIMEIISEKYKNIENLTSYELAYIIFDEIVSEHIIQPTFVTSHPSKFSGLSKSDNGIAERAELYIGGIEICNLYSELNDPFLQEKFFKTQSKVHRDIDFINALKIGMPHTSGAGIGVNRLHMLLLNLYNIKNSLIFPMYKDKS